jgi:tRNA pseudouridine55 synthase
MGSAGGPTDGLLVVDKPAGWTSHDVVARTRRLAGTRRVGHAGTLDPMATGVLVLGLGKATRLLGHLTLTEKAYDATIRLGAATLTDDAEGEVTATTPAGEVTEQAISSVSAIKVDGERAYRRVRAGDEVTLAARPVVVSRFEVLAVRRTGDTVDVDVSVVCSSGTYVRALARDLGAALAVGGHLRALRRTRVGPYDLEGSRTLEQLEVELNVLPMAAAVRAVFPVREVDAAAAVVISHGGPLPALGLGPVPVAVLGPDGAFLALVEERDGRAKPTAVFV